MQNEGIYKSRRIGPDRATAIRMPPETAGKYYEQFVDGEKVILVPVRSAPE